MYKVVKYFAIEKNPHCLGMAIVQRGTYFLSA
jgi:hypothetical protein